MLCVLPFSHHNSFTFFWGLVTRNSCLFLSEILAWSGRTRERKKKDAKIFHCKFLSFTVSHTFIFCCRSSLNGIRDFISYTLHFYTQYIEWYKAGRRSRQVRKRTEVAGWARKSLFPSIACNFVYFELESETKARAEKNLKFPIFHAPAKAWTEITNHQKKSKC